jgi:lipopolysaccharide transport system permease protein
MFLKKPFQVLYKNRKILVALTKDDIKKKYAGSTLGLVWMFLYPLLFLLAYAFVYSVVLRIRLEIMTTTEYIMMVFSGLLPFLSFSEMLGTSSMSIVSNAALLRNTLITIDTLPVKAVFISQPTQVVGMIFLLVATLIFGTASQYTILIVPIWALQMLFNMGIAWLLAALNVAVRDIQTIIPLLSLLLMFISPVAYTVDMIPAKLRFVMSFNPLYYFITSYQSVLVLKTVPSLINLLIMVIMSIAVFYLGYWVFSTMKRILADYV